MWLAWSLAPQIDVGVRVHANGLGRVRSGHFLQRAQILLRAAGPHSSFGLRGAQVIVLCAISSAPARTQLLF